LSRRLRGREAVGPCAKAAAVLTRLCKAAKHASTRSVVVVVIIVVAVLTAEATEARRRLQVAEGVWCW